MFNIATPRPSYLRFRPRKRNRNAVLTIEQNERRILLATTSAFQNAISSAIPAVNFTSIAVGAFNSQDQAAGFAVGGLDGVVSVYRFESTSGVTLSARQQVGKVNDAVTALASGLFDNATDEPDNVGLAVLGTETLTILLGDGTGGNFATPVNQPPIDLSGLMAPGATAVGIAAGSFLGSSAVDLAVLDSKGEVFLFAGDGKGDFTDVSTLPGPADGSKYTAVAAGYFGGHDAKVDLAVGDSAGNLHIFDGNGNGTFSAESTFSVNPSPIEFIAADPTETIIGTPPTSIDQGLLISDNDELFKYVRDESGSFGNTVTVQGQPTSFAVTSPLDSVPNDQIPSFLFTVGSEVFGSSDLPLTGEITPYASRDSEQVEGNVGHFDSSSHPSIVSLSYDGTIRIAEGDGFGHFTYSTKIAYVNTRGNNLNSPAASKMVVADFNLDGISDVAVFDDLGHLRVFLGDGDDGLVAAPASDLSSVSLNGFDVASGDFNNDGTIDLAANDSLGNLVILTGDGTGRFTALAPIPSPSGITGGIASLAAGQFQSGGADLAVSYSSGQVVIYHGLGNDTPPTSTVVDSGGSYSFVVAGKFRDSASSYDDLAIATATNIIVLGNADDGTGGFPADLRTTTSLANSLGFGKLYAVDLDGDHKIDLDSGGTELFINQGNGTFGPAVQVRNSDGSMFAIGMSAANVNDQTDDNVDLILFTPQSIDVHLATTAPAKLVSIADVRGIEGDPSSITANPGFTQPFMFILIFDSTPLRGSIDLKTVDLTAEGGIDYQAVNETFAISNEQTSITVMVRADFVIEAAERMFRLVASNPVGIDPSSAGVSAVGTIVEDDGLVVNTTSDILSPGTGNISLRKAIVVADATNADPVHHQAGGATITFNLPSYLDYYQINLDTSLPALTGPTRIEGRSQPNLGQASVSYIVLQFNKFLLYSPEAGLVLLPGSAGSAVDGFWFRGTTTQGILVDSQNAGAVDAARTYIYGNRFADSSIGIGISASSNVDIGVPSLGEAGRNFFTNGRAGIWLNDGSTGITITDADVVETPYGIVLDGASGNTIGAASPLTGPFSNTIANANLAGILLMEGSANNVVLGNRIVSSNPSAFPDQAGILLNDASGNSIGYLGNQGNLIDGVGGIGISLLKSSDANFVSGNQIQHTGISDIRIYGSSGNQVFGNTLGAGSNGIILGGQASGNVIGYGPLSDGLSRGNAIDAQTERGILLVEGAVGNLLYGNTIAGASIGIQLTNAILNAIGRSVAGSSPGSGFGNAITGSSEFGIALQAGSDTNTIAGNLVSGSGDADVVLDDSNANGVYGNWIGTDAAGQASFAVPGHIGVLLRGGASDNQIGDATDSPGHGPGNVISGHTGDGVFLTGGATGNLIAGNAIGVDASGSIVIPNENGIDIQGAPANLIGTTTSRYRNIAIGNRNRNIVSNVPYNEI